VPLARQLQSSAIALSAMSLKKSLGYLFFLLILVGNLQAKTFKYKRIGQQNAIQTKTSAGIAMMGGGSDLDEAVRWLCDKSNGTTALTTLARQGTSMITGILLVIPRT